MKNPAALFNAARCCGFWLTLTAASVSLSRAQTAPAAQVAITVDVKKPLGPMPPLWAYFGYDEPNYTYLNDGQKLLTELAALSPVPVYVRAHNLLTTGDGTPGLKWGSTNAYTEDKEGRPVYDWTIVDRIFDTYHQRGKKPIAQIGFMPEAFSTHPAPYRHFGRRASPTSPFTPVGPTRPKTTRSGASWCTSG
ncbi:MAG: hypothetical protein NVSMB30_04470 [Hymenobacter sp.]